MASWRKNESFSHALAREGRSIARGVGKELLSIATMGLYKSKRRSTKAGKRRR